MKFWYSFPYITISFKSIQIHYISIITIKIKFCSLTRLLLLRIGDPLQLGVSVCISVTKSRYFSQLIYYFSYPLSIYRLLLLYYSELKIRDLWPYGVILDQTNIFTKDTLKYQNLPNHSSKRFEPFLLW